MATFGRYEILERLAVGGMAEVYRARAVGPSGFAKDVVIKKILPGYSSDPEFRSLFIHEARISVGLTHSRITQVLDFGLMDGSYFIAMELVDGPDLGDLLRMLRKDFTRMPLPAAVHVIAEVLEGLDYAHRRTGTDGKPLSIVHRDISPNNVLVSREGEVKLTDFGIARAAGSPSMTQVGRVRGKPQYMSPEQIRGMPLDGRSDLFSCGLLFYELLTGFPAYAGPDDSLLMHAILRGELEPASARVKEVPRALDAVVERALHLDVNQRFATATEFRQALLDVAYAYRIRPESEALAAVVRGRFPSTKERPVIAPSALVDLTGEEGELGRYSTSNAIRIPTADTADSELGSRAATTQSDRGPVFIASPSGESTAAMPLAPERPSIETEATSILERRPGTDPDASARPESRSTLPPSTPRPVFEAPTNRMRPVVPASRFAATGRWVAVGLGVVLLVVGYVFAGTRPSAEDRTVPTPVTRVATPIRSIAVPSPTPTTAVASVSPLVVRTVATPMPTPTRTTASVVMTPVRTVPPTPKPRPGTLSLNSRPWGEVTIDGRAVGPTPIVELSLPPGTYSVVITNTAAGVGEKFPVTIESGKTFRRSVELK